MAKKHGGSPDFLLVRFVGRVHHNGFTYQDGDVLLIWPEEEPGLMIHWGTYLQHEDRTPTPDEEVEAKRRYNLL